MLIFSIVFVTGVAEVIISLMLPNTYRSEATIIPRTQEKNSVSSAISPFSLVSPFPPFSPLFPPAYPIVPFLQ
jgi:hypothetical protein